jgi:hypothetical protein
MYRARTNRGTADGTRALGKVTRLPRFLVEASSLVLQESKNAIPVGIRLVLLAVGIGFGVGTIGIDEFLGGGFSGMEPQFQGHG